MKNLQAKKIIVGVAGSIAAYKAALLVRELVKAGCEVQVIMTTASKDFITPLTLATLSKRPALSDFVQNQAGEWNNHVELGLWADAILIAPATANTLSKLANGACSDLLTAVYLSARCPVFIAPAMDLDMYQHPSTLENLRKLNSYGNTIIPAEDGELASGLYGQGRLAEPERLLQYLNRHFSRIESLVGKKILITAGPTQEAIDPVRFVSNHSSGKMGFAIADAFADAGAEVKIISGPVNVKPKNSLVKAEKVRSAQEMYEAAKANFDWADVVIYAAAVADYTPAYVADKKIKKKEATFSIELIKTTDIAAKLGNQKRVNQLVVGFALETDNELLNAQDKLRRKNFDMIVLNSLQDGGAGFQHDTNKITIIKKDGSQQDFELKPKTDVALDILQAIEVELGKV